MIFGIGITDIKTTGKMKPYYKRWTNMMSRCYSPIFKEKHPTYEDCYVCEDWLLFSNFAEWMSKQDWEGKHLDKDILFQGNKEYSPSKCVFVDRYINQLINFKKNNSGPYLKGAVLDKRRGLFKCSLSYKGKNKIYGYFKTEIEAHEKYKEVKSKIILEAAMGLKEPLKSALINFKL